MSSEYNGKGDKTSMTETIKLIVVDIDGTLLNSQHELSERNEKALRAAMEQGVPVVLATGKTRTSALSLISRLNLTSPGIFVQGLAIYDGNGNIQHQTTLDTALARRVITFAEDRGYNVLAYSGDSILARRRNRLSDVLVEYGEPEPQIVGPLQNILHDTVVNKLIVADDDARRIKALRWQLSMQIDGSGQLVQSNIDHMLEILPRGISKAVALRMLLKEMHLVPARVLAIGDGENDVDMLRMAGIGVAVGNARSEAREAADYVVASNDDDGVAEAVERFVLKSEETETSAAGVVAPAAETTPAGDQPEDTNED